MEYCRTTNSQRRYFSTQGSHQQSNDHPETPDAELEKILGNTTETDIAAENKNSQRRSFSTHAATQSSQQEYGCNAATLNLTLSKTTSPCSLKVKVADQDATMITSSWKILRPWLDNTDTPTMSDELISHGVWDLFQHDPLPNLGDQSSLADLSALNFWDVIQSSCLRNAKLRAPVMEIHNQGMQLWDPATLAARKTQSKVQAPVMEIHNQGMQLKHPKHKAYSSYLEGIPLCKRRCLCYVENTHKDSSNRTAPKTQKSERKISQTRPPNWHGRQKKLVFLGKKCISVRRIKAKQ